MADTTKFAPVRPSVTTTRSSGSLVDQFEEYKKEVDKLFREYQIAILQLQQRVKDLESE